MNIKKEPLVSIGVPTFNRPKELDEKLKNLLMQTYENIEIVISDNASSDPEVDFILNKYSNIDNRIKVYKQSRNIGAAENFLFVFKASNGEFFMWAADDDWHDKDFIKQGIKFISGNDIYNAWFCNLVSINNNLVIREYKNFSRFTSTKNKLKDLIYYTWDPEIMGKANLIYSLYKYQDLKKVINLYTFSNHWGSDMTFNLAFLIRFNIYVDKDIYFKKRNKNYYIVNIKKPFRYIFPLEKSYEYLYENYLAIKKEKYFFSIATILIIKLILAIYNFFYFKTNNLKNLFFK